MAGAIMSKLMDFIGMEQEDDEEEYETEEQEDVEEQEDDEEEESRGFWNKRSNSKVVNMPSQQQVKMVISQPTTFEQSETICDLLKDVARRIVDVVSGAVHALDGHMQKISNSIFLIAPYNYDITNDMARGELPSKLSVSWLKNN